VTTQQQFLPPPLKSLGSTLGSWARPPEARWPPVPIVPILALGSTRSLEVFQTPSRGKPDKAGVLKFTKTQVKAKSDLMTRSSAFELFTSFANPRFPSMAVQNCPRQHQPNEN